VERGIYPIAVLNIIKYSSNIMVFLDIDEIVINIKSCGKFQPA